MSRLGKLLSFLTRNASKTNEVTSFIPGLTGPSARMAGKVQLPPAIANKFSTSVKPITYPGIGTASTSTLPNVTIPKQTVSPGFAPVGQKEAAEAISRFNSTFGTNIGKPLAGLTSPLTSAAAPAAQKGFLRKAGGFLGRNVVLSTALVGGATDVISSLLPGSANSIANEGKVGGSYQLGLSPTKQLMRKLELGYTDETLGEKRKNLLEEKYGQMAKTAGVYLPSVVDSSNEQIKYAIEEGLRGVRKSEQQADLDAAQRRQNQVQMAQLQNNLEVQKLNSDIAMKGFDIQEGLIDRANKRNTLESVLALIALMKQDV